MSTIEYLVTGMTCEHCVAAVSNAVTSLPDVAGVEVDLASGRLRIESASPPARAAVAAAVDEAGYHLA